MSGQGRWIAGAVVVGALAAWVSRSALARLSAPPVPEDDGSAVAAIALEAARAAASGPVRPANGDDARVWVCRHALPERPLCREGQGADEADAAAQAAAGTPPLGEGTLTLDVLVRSRGATWPGDANPADAGRFGIAVGPAVILPWEVLASGLYRTIEEDQGPEWDEAAIAATIRERGGHVGRVVSFERLETRSYVQEGPGAAPIRLERLHARQPPDSRDPQVLSAAARAMADHLAAITGPDGRVEYLYDPTTGRVLEGENLLRHAGSIYALVEAWGRFRDPAYLDAARRATTYLLERTTVDERRGPYGGGRARHVVEGSSAKLGGAALALVAIDTYRIVTGDAAAWATEAGELATFVLAQQRADGSFVSHASVEPGGEDPGKGESEYYPGEAILALSLHATLDPDPRWLQAAVRADDWLSGVRDRGKGPDELPADAWRMLASHQLYLDTGDPRWVDRGLELAAPAIYQFRLHQDRERHDFAGGFHPIPRSTPCSTRSAGLAAVLASCDAAGRRCDELEPVLYAAVSHALWSQVDPRTDFWVVSPEHAMGGLMGGVVDPLLRNDFTQHALSAVLATEATTLRRSR